MSVMDKMMDALKDPTFAFLAVSAALKYAIFMAWYDKRPKTAELVGRVAALHLHPVKSCGTIELEEALCDFTGMYSNGFSDRGWIVTLRQGDKWRMITARREPTIELIQSSLHGESLHLDAPGMDTLVLPRQAAITGNTVGVTDVWDEDIEGIDLGDAAGRWLNAYLGKLDEDFRLLQHSPELEKRRCDEGSVADFQTVAKEADKVMYQDVAPLHLCTQQSLDDLNEKATSQITMKQFRPNIVVDGCSRPFEEDGWDDIWIGDGKFTMLFLCDRCMQTTVNPETGIRDPRKEPKTTLEKYRTLVPDESPIFGITLVTNKAAIVKVGDPVYATRRDKIELGTTGIIVNV